MARAAARRGAYAQSQELLRRANTVEPGSPLVEALVAEVLEEQERQRQLDAQRAGVDSVRLDAAFLCRRCEQLAYQLADVAHRLNYCVVIVLYTSRHEVE